jgi:hypothetical protein
MRGMHATSRRRRGPFITLQTVLHYSAGYSSRSMEFFGFKSGLYCSSRFSDAMSSLT